MAGVGFELRRLFREEGLIGSVKAYVYSSVTTVGPMILCMIMVFVMQFMMYKNNVAYLERELFLTTVVYAFIFSVLVTGGLSMLLTRFIADRMFEGKNEHLLSSYYGAIAVCLPIGGIAAWLFLSRVDAGVGYKAATYLLFAELIVVWIQSVHLSALKDYGRIVRHFAYGIAIAIGGTWLVLRYTEWKTATAVVTMMGVGFFFVIWLSGRHFIHVFPQKQSKLLFHFLKYAAKYPSLLVIGTMVYIGVYSHTFVYWFADGTTVARAYHISPFYDLPVFYAYLTIVPTLVTFVVSVETSFYEKFRNYYSKILNGGTLSEVANAKREMQRTLMREISFVMEVQMVFTIISLALGIKLLPAIGFTMAQLDTFKILVLGYFLFIMAFIMMLIMLYFDDRKGVTAISLLLVALNIGFTWWTMENGYHGLGLFIASFVALAIALARLMYFLRNIDYFTFCRQPIVTRSKKTRRKAVQAKGVISTIVVIALLTGCTPDDNPSGGAVPEAVAPAVTDSDKLVEDKRVYERDDDYSVKTLYITIYPDDEEDKKTPLTWYGLNRLREYAEEGRLNIIMQEGAADGSGPEAGKFGYGESEINGKISLRGNSTRYLSQRSYKINLNERAGLWNDQRVLNLNKHISEGTRIRNKLSFDLFENIPDFVSLRTQFVHLYVKDLSEGQSAQNQPYEDYGLFTHVEQPNKMFLRNHWLDPNGQLYKATMFEFFRYQDELKEETDPAYDSQLFETRLEIRGREEHGKLLAMLDEVNDLSIPIEEVMEKHFNEDNFLTWMAVNILTDNIDTNSQNFLLYSPLNSMKWYFIPWDYDGGWGYERKRNFPIESTSGISTYWGSELQNRYFRSEDNVKKLEAKIDELYRKFFNEDIVKEKVEKYARVAKKYLNRAPDIGFLPDPLSQIDEEYHEMISIPQQTIQWFKDDIERPKPVFLDDLKQDGQALHFEWGHSFDLQGDDLTYDWILAKDVGFTRIVASKKGLTSTSIDISGIAPGTYYWTVKIKDAKGNLQLPFDIYTDEEDEWHFGMRQIEVF